MKKICFSDIMAETYGDPSSLSAFERRLFKETPSLLHACLDDNLTAVQKKYILMYYKEGLNIVEIAQLCGVNRSTVSRTIKRGRERMLKAMKCRALRNSIKH